MALKGYHVPDKHKRTPSKAQWLIGPCMEFDIEIDGQIVRRQGHLAEFYEQGVYWIAAADDPDLMPRHFILNQHFPWYHFKPWLLHAWAEEPVIHFCFKPLKRIPDPIIDNLKLLPEAEFIQALEALRARGFLPKLKTLDSKIYFKPASMTWEETRQHCFKAHEVIR